MDLPAGSYHLSALLLRASMSYFPPARLMPSITSISLFFTRKNPHLKILVESFYDAPAAGNTCKISGLNLLPHLKKRSGSSLAGRLQEDGKWVTEYCKDSKDTNHQEHNHARNKATAFASIRTESLETRREEVITLWNAGIRPKDILTDLRKNHNLHITFKDMTNLLAKHRREELAGLTPIQWLYDTLRSSTEYWWKGKRDETGRVQSLFLVPRTGIELIQRHPFILKFDCTYKKNRFNMPLLNTCGASATKSAPSLGCCFLSTETKASYAWTLRQLRELIQEEQIPLPTCVITRPLQTRHMPNCTGFA